MTYKDKFEDVEENKIKLEKGMEKLRNQHSEQDIILSKLNEEKLEDKDALREMKQKFNEENLENQKALREMERRFNELVEKYNGIVSLNSKLFISQNFKEFEYCIRRLTDVQIQNFEENELYEGLVCLECIVNNIHKDGKVEVVEKGVQWFTINFQLRNKAKEELLKYSKGDTIQIFGRLSSVLLKEVVWGNPIFNIGIKDTFIIDTPVIKKAV